MNGYGSHTFKMVNAKGEAVYCKFHVKVRKTSFKVAHGATSITPNNAIGTKINYFITNQCGYYIVHIYSVFIDFNFISDPL